MHMYKVAEKFKSIQGEGMYAGTPMAFIRFVGCSVGKRICQHCDTDFDTMMGWRGGGEYSADELIDWADNYEHICLTGGEPLNQDLEPILEWVRRSVSLPGIPGIDLPGARAVHIETSGTVSIPQNLIRSFVHICISPKPGWLETNMAAAHEIKVIVPGLGDKLPAVPAVEENPDSFPTWRWPSLADALRWAALEPDRPVYLQPRNGKYDLDKNNLVIVQDLIREYPQLRLSAQLHKILRVQ